MSAYRNYPISCKTCGEPIAIYAEEYERLVNNGDETLTANQLIEQALNTLGVMRPCSRINLKDAPTVKFERQDPQIIEGIKDIATAKLYKIDIDQNATITPSTCANLYSKEVLKRETAEIGEELSDDEDFAGVFTKESKYHVPSKASNQKELEEEIDPSLLEEYIEIAEIEPTIIGIPVIIKNDQVFQDNIVVGPNRSVKILSGRTFLCR